jgi:hypothetical protein
MRTSNKDKFITKANLIHNNKYEYNLVIYNNSMSKVIIVCKQHGNFLQKPNDHLSKRGCPKCSGRHKTTIDFINQANKVHNFKYNYSESNYIKSNLKIKILCAEHGIFEQAPYSHLKGIGCPKCGIYKSSFFNGWTKTNWKNTGNNSKNFDSFKVYIIKCWNKNEEFYKIGRTFLKIKNRFCVNKKMPYNFKVIQIFTGTAEKIYDLENELKRKNKLNKYIPLIEFRGMYECFKQVII